MIDERPTPSLLCVLEHPTQYDGPLWLALAARGVLRPIVWYRSMKPPADPEQAQSVHWGAEEDAQVVPRRYDIKALRGDLERLSPRPAAILTAGWPQKSSWICRSVGRAHGIPVILPSDAIFLGPVSPARALAKTAFHVVKNRLFDGFFTTGTLGSSYLRALGVPQQQIACGVYPVDVAYWQARLQSLAGETSAIRGRIGAESFVVLSVCKLHQRENPLGALEAFALLPRSVPRAHMVMVGDGPLRAAVESRVRDLGLAERVHLEGYVPYPRLAAYYGAADVFVHAPKFEPWGISIAEAMACGRPAVTTPNVGSSHDLIEDGRTGFIARTAAPADVALALESVARRGPGALSRACLERVTRTLDVRVVAAGLEELVVRLSAAEIRQQWMFRSFRHGYRSFRDGARL